MADESELEEELEEELHEFKSTDQLKFEQLIQRLGQASLLCSALLFIGQIIAVSVTNHADPSSIISGFIISFLLFLAWFCIQSVYGDSFKAPLQIRQSLDFQLRIRSVEEMKLMIPKNWIACLASELFLSSFVMSISEIYLMYHGITSYYSDLGPIHGVRIGLSVIFVCTGITSLCLITRVQKRSTNIATLCLAIASLISASALASFWYLRADMRFVSTMGWQSYDSTKNKVLSKMEQSPKGQVYFPFFPWTPIMVTMNCFPLMNIAVSLALMAICFHLMFAIEITGSEEEEKEDEEKSTYFALIGAVFLAAGFANNICMIILPNLGFFTNHVVLHCIFGPLTTLSLLMMIGGILAICVAEVGGLAKKFVLFVLSLAISGSAILAIYHISSVLSQATFESHEYNVDFHCLHRNETHVCLENCGLDGKAHECHDYDMCITPEKICNGVLDLFNITHYNQQIEACQDRPFQLVHFYDELFCRNKWIAVYICIFGFAALSIVCSVATWIISLEAIISVFRYTRNAVRRALCAQEPIINS